MDVLASLMDKPGDDNDDLNAQNELRITTPNDDAAIDLYRNLMNDEIARARIEKMRIEKNVLIIRSKVGKIAELADIADAIEKASKKAL